MKKLILIILLSSNLAYADKMMDDYKKQSMGRESTFKGKYEDLRNEYKDEFQSNELEKYDPPVTKSAEKEPVNNPNPTQSVNKPSKINENSFNKDDAAEMGRMMMKGSTGAPINPDEAIKALSRKK